MVRPSCLGLIIKGPSSQHVIPKLWLLLPQECVKIQMCSSHVKKKNLTLKVISVLKATNNTRYVLYFKISI